MAERLQDRCEIIHGERLTGVIDFPTGQYAICDLLRGKVEERGEGDRDFLIERIATLETKRQRTRNFIR